MRVLQRVQDQILHWVREGRWDRVVQEKRNVLVCMQQVLQSCHTLLDSTQIPVDGVVRLLQHILRCACCSHGLLVCCLPSHDMAADHALCMPHIVSHMLCS